MKAWRDSWSKVAARYAALELRERRMVALAAILGPLLLGNSLLVDPLLARAANLRRTTQQQQTSLRELTAQAADLQARVQADPDAAKKAELAAVKERLAGADERFKKLQSTLVPPEEMNAFLERLLARHAGLRLVSLKTLSPESLLGTQQGADGKPAPLRQFDIYRHGVELRLEGSYLELLAYLEQLEKADRKILWGPMRLSVVEYPKSQLTVTVYTLGSDPAWLAL